MAGVSTIRRHHLGRGFTLLELLVVLALATLLIALVPPLISAALPGVELKSSARKVAASVRRTERSWPL